MLQLIITSADTDLAFPAGPAGLHREVWRDENGEVFARGHVVDDAHWMQVPGVGTFRFDSRAEAIVAKPERSAPRELVVDAYRRLVLPNALQALGHEVLHASAVLARYGVVGLCARAHTGKSTTAYGLSRRGHPLWADDAVAFEIAGQSVRALPLPFTLRLRPQSLSLFDADEVQVPAGDLVERTRPAPLAALFMLERQPEGTSKAEIFRLTPREAVVALLANAYWFSLADQERKRKMLSQYLDLSALVPVFKLRFAPGPENLGAVLDGVEGALEPLDDRRERVF